MTRPFLTYRKIRLAGFCNLPSSFCPHSLTTVLPVAPSGVVVVAAAVVAGV